MEVDIPVRAVAMGVRHTCSRNKRGAMSGVRFGRASATGGWSCCKLWTRRTQHLAVLVSVLLLAMNAMERVGAITNAQDVLALKQVKMAVNAVSIMPSSCLGSWNFSVDPCNARSTAQFTCGIDCTSGFDGVWRVTGLRLEAAGYNGTLSPYIGNLSALQRVIVSGNSLEGSIPATLGQLKELFQLDLSSNNFSGTLPESLSLLSNLEFFSVANNVLEGQIPSSFNSMVNVTQMYLNNNRLSGAIPNLSGMKSLYYVDASTNNLTGRLPSGFPPALSILSLGRNQLVGPLPPILSNLNLLQALDLRNNHLSGGVGAFVFTMSSLQQLNLSYNSFTSLGVTNLSVANSQLLSLDLSYNQIGGPLPEAMASMKKLSVLSLRGNKFTGPIPDRYALKAANTLSGTEQLGQLYLDSNYLTGDIPSPLVRLSPDSISANLVNNCLRSCPPSLFFCQGGGQRSAEQCKIASSNT